MRKKNRKLLKTAIKGSQKLPSRIKHKRQRKESKSTERNFNVNQDKPKKSLSVTNNNRLLQFYKPTDKILLVGEGDFSFTKSLLLPPHSLDPGNITATVYDNRNIILQKYSDTAAGNIDFLEKASKSKILKEDDEEDVDEEDIDKEDFNCDSQGQAEEGTDRGTEQSKSINLMFSVDATALHKIKALKKKKFDCCVFNFPHTGAGITDQDRNILKNQELLLAFLKSALNVLDANGVIVISLFEGLPYSLWNLKELALSCGLNTIRSGKFVWDHYLGYKHRRTSGVGDTTKKANERAARMFIFQRKNATVEREKRNKKRKRSTEDDTSSDSD
ncbi:hypothetical protein V1511DRAFT_494696 [Dipodascopsis uninucleata]